MDELEEMRFEKLCATALTALRAERHRCPDPERLLAWAEGEAGIRAPGDDGDPHDESIEMHVGACVACLDAVDSLHTDSIEVDEEHWRSAAQRLDQRGKPWLAGSGGAAVSSLPSFRLAAAILLGAAVGASAVWLAIRPAPPPLEVERGPAIQVIAPVGSLEEATDFEWAIPFPILLTYRIEVEVGGRIVWTAAADSVEDRRMTVPDDVRRILAQGDVARWRVVGLSESGKEVATSAWVELAPSRPREAPAPR